MQYILRYFARGSLQRHIASTYRVSKQAFGGIIDQVCNAIHAEMRDEIPALSKEQWLNVANSFNARWNFPNCVGAIDGKHVPIKRPQNAGSLFFNYKVNVLYLFINLYTTDTNLSYQIIVEIPQHCIDGRRGCRL